MIQENKAYYYHETPYPSLTKAAEAEAIAMLKNIFGPKRAAWPFEIIENSGKISAILRRYHDTVAKDL